MRSPQSEYDISVVLKMRAEKFVSLIVSSLMEKVRSILCFHIRIFPFKFWKELSLEAV